MTYIIQGSFQLHNTTNPNINLFPILFFRRLNQNKSFLIRKNMLLLILIFTLI